VRDETDRATLRIEWRDMDAFYSVPLGMSKKMPSWHPRMVQHKKGGPGAIPR
jgi:hypothetical protein